MPADFSELKSVISYVLNPNRIRLNSPLLDLLRDQEEYETDLASLRQYLAEGTDADIQPLITFINSAVAASASTIKPQPLSEPDTPERLKWVISKLGLSEIADAIEKRMPRKEASVIVEENFRQWYTSERQAASTNYWDGYTRVLSRNGWDARSIDAVGEQATEVIRRIEDPTAEHYLSARGLVVGYVQSGKTANFTAVAAKAIDAGYRLIVILAGTLDNLRNQTQRRLDKELMGREAILDGRIEEEMTAKELKDESYFSDDEEWDREWDEKGDAFISHGPTVGSEGFPRIRRLTTSVKDYQHFGHNLIDLERPDKSLPVHDKKNLDNMPCMVAVVKKNASVLENFNMDLRRAAQKNSDLLDLPVLVIDDESDQASINTKDNRKRSENEEIERTAVNHQITRLLQNCPRSQYVGYTATPFANVFVDPDDAEDIYPQHFVLMLNEPPAYRGAKWFHDRMDFADDPESATIKNSRSKAFIRDLVEEGEFEEKSFQDMRDAELQEALDMFFLTAAVKKFREAKHGNLSFKHHTMLVHEGVTNDKHRDAKRRLDEMWTSRRYNLPRPNPELKRLFEEDLLPVMKIKSYNAGYAVPESFEELRPYFNEAYAEMMTGVERGGSPILQVDSEGKDSPNFEAGKVWKVMVGGAKLSRGYTVEGLTVSYFRRRTGGADTLMQTGRWFGFRKGYQDLVRLYAPPTLVESFEAAMHDEEIFRDNIKAYSNLDAEDKPELTPRRLAPLVHQSLPDLKPTSRNKMFNAFIKSTAAAPKCVEFNSVPESREALAENFKNVARPMLRALSPVPAELAFFRREKVRSDDPFAYAGFKSFYVGKISARNFLKYFDAMKWYEGIAYKENIVAPHLEYLKGLMGKGRHADHTNSDFSEVAVILPIKAKTSVKKSKVVHVPGIEFAVPLVDRSRREGRHDITGTDRKYTYIIENIAAGNLATEPRPEDLELYEHEMANKFTARDLEDPFIVDGFEDHARGAVLLTLFDDRPKHNQFDEDGSYIEPSFRDGEVGVALAFGSPHAAIKSDTKVVEWGVRVPGNGEDEPVVVDKSSVSE